MFLACAIRLLALLLTPLLRRFFWSAELLTLGGLPLPLRFSPLAAWSAALTGDGEERSAPAKSCSLSGDGDLPTLSAALSFGLVLDAGSDTELASAFSDFEPPELELPRNILFSRPPCEERLRRVLPARVVGKEA